MSPTYNQSQPTVAALHRINICYAILLFVVGLFILRSFYVQVIRYDFYHKAALSDQLKQYQIPASRGIIEAYNGNSVIPLVLNQTMYTIYADPTYITNADKDAHTISRVLGGSVSMYEAAMQTKNTEYVVLANKVPESQKDKLLAHKYPGIGAQAQDYRTYPQGELASQLLGFVNDSGQGEYGVEQALNKELSGTPGEVKALTDASGVPLVASGDNVQTAPQNGDNVVLSIDMGMQYQMEQILQQEYQKTNSQGLSAIIMNPNNGQIKAMANYPTYNPSNYQDVTNPSLFENAAVTNAIEPGSSMKTLTTSAALNSGAIQPNESFYDPAHWVIDGFNITDIEQDGGPRQQNIASILALSLNTGAVWMLMQMSDPGNTQINLKGIDTWHDYMVNHFRLGQPTGIEQGYESSGYVPPVNTNYPALDLQYANTAFGQGVQLTALQLGAALSGVLNGGTYYQPTLVAQTVNPNTGQTVVNQPKVLERNVVSPKVGQELIPLMQNVVTTYFHEGYSFMNFSPDYLVGGKTGTAQVAKPSGGYYSNIYNGTYIGFVGGTTKPQYVIVVFNIKPNVPGYAGALGGQPVFADLAHMLINEGYVLPKN
jgi:cell division protein FtsI/penicillin-binding protein 2